MTADTDWKKLYLDFLNNMRDPDGNPYDPSIFSTGFIYVNNDSVPEMVISTMSEAGGNLIAGIFHGEVKTYQTARLGLRYVEKRNIIDNADGHMGGYYDELLRMILNRCRPERMAFRILRVRKTSRAIRRWITNGTERAFHRSSTGKIWKKLSTRAELFPGNPA